MSYEEKGTWVDMIAVLVVSGIYFASVLSRVGEVPVGEIKYIRPLITAIIATIFATIAGYIVAAISAPSEADKKDERDKDIHRFGGSVGFTVLGVMNLLPLGLAMAEAEPFWIANAIFLAGVVAATVSSIFKIVAYRRGL
jgi:hypothetical protein